MRPAALSSVAMLTTENQQPPLALNGTQTYQVRYLLGSGRTAFGHRHAEFGPAPKPRVLPLVLAGGTEVSLRWQGRFVRVSRRTSAASHHHSWI